MLTWAGTGGGRELSVAELLLRMLVLFFLVVFTDLECDLVLSDSRG